MDSAQSNFQRVLQFDRRHYSNDQLIQIYKRLLKPRMIEEKMLNLLRQGQVSKWFSGIGQEAVAVAVPYVLEYDEYILPMHRNLGVFTGRDIPFAKLFSQWQGKKNGFSKGRERSFHFGTNEYHIVGMISHLGPQLAVADGIALAAKLKNEKKVTAVFTGEGATSEGDFHESLNVAAVWDLPVIFIVENNGYGLSTPTNEQFRCAQIADKAIGYGMRSMIVDGNNILDMVAALEECRAYCINEQKPVLLECMTFRMRGHEEASGIKYVPKELIEMWGKKDPVQNYEQYLLESAIINEEMIKTFRDEIKSEIEAGVQTVFNEPEVIPDTEEEERDIYAPFTQEVIAPKSNIASQKKFINAISDALKLAMDKYPELIIMGQDIAEYGGAFKVTEGFVQQYGKSRVRNTPICESAILGAGCGLSVKKMKSVIEMQFADFVTSGFNPIINNMAKMYYRWGQNVDSVVRMPTGAGVGAGPFHSQSNEAWFFHTPGLKVVYPSSVYDAKGLLLAAIEDPNPVMFFEHKALYRAISDNIPDDYYTVEIGKAALAQSGNELSIITYGMGVHWAKKACAQLQIDADILDLRTLLPLDYDAIATTVRKTGKVLVLHEDTLIGGIGGEIAAYISEQLFNVLDAPVMRCASLDTPVPFSLELEKNFLPESRLIEKLKALASY
ncbi:MAG TPA: dehydrogenase E1 component subunit alpha/beta [Chitinophagales bacterium]|nr:dehydrogenase E1 component subunit alpha/beta [Chitinophagales bacterium]HNF68290.1 dehydrogenase E1 component subunit alpha/beta [Chitinophagales bacterium]HNI52949.1 dehydrogenase E1 component subunit alpha/beta [Chitinophagales bacterium]HNM09511.1 dehydrogenase E1 component subunit alpha/beta [Chitinophagales bacterium]HNO27607.1 dehydrogenase E1 component subunit alpha/beta [Chitinophagales bacterium]